MDTKQYILDERKKGTPDEVIFQNLQNMNAPELASTAPAPERGFAGQILPTATGIAGGIVGGALGVAGGPPGIVAGSILGSAAGGALGETAQQGLEISAGNRTNINSGQIGAAAATQGALEGLGRGAGAAVGAAGKYIVKPAIDAARPPIVTFLSKMSGYADDLVEKALSRSPGVRASLEGGEKALNDILTRATKKFHEVANASLEAARATMKQLDTQYSLGGRGQDASRAVVLKEATDFVNSATKALRSEHNIGVAKDGTLSFAREANPSRIVSGAEKQAIQESFRILNNIKANTSISNIDATLERLLVLQRKTPSGTPTGPESKKIIGQMIENLKKFASTTYPEFTEELEKNFKQRILITEGKEILGDTANLSPAELAKLTKQMLQLFNSGNLSRREAVKTIGNTVSEDITGGAAGALMRQGDQVSVRASNLTRRGVVEKAVEFIPRTVVQNYARTGKITGNMSYSPQLKTIASILGISVDALIREAATLSQNNTTE